MATLERQVATSVDLENSEPYVCNPGPAEGGLGYYRKGNGARDSTLHLCSKVLTVGQTQARVHIAREIGACNNDMPHA